MMRKKNFKVRQITRFFALFLIVAMVFGCVHPAFTARADEDVSVVTQTEESLSEEEEEVSESVVESDTEAPESEESEEESETEETKQTEEIPETNKGEDVAESSEDLSLIVTTKADEIGEQTSVVEDSNISETTDISSSENEAINDNEFLEMEGNLASDPNLAEKEEDKKLSLYERLMATSSEDKYWAIINDYTDEELAKIESELTNEQKESLINKLRELGALPFSVSEGNTYPGPIIWPSKKVVPVVTKSTKKRMLKSTKSATNGISLDKKIKKTGDNAYTITLETYTTGQVTIVTEPRPVDIVLVLDTSGSMREEITVGSKNDTSELDTVYGSAAGMYNITYPLSGNHPMRYSNGKWQYRYLGSWHDVENSVFGMSITVSKINALKIAAQRFVDAVNEKAEEDGVDHRISIVRYATNASTPLDLTSVTTGSDTIKNGIKALSADGATAIDYGTDYAKAVLDGVPEDRESAKVVIMFTDGEPTHGNSFDDTVANAAIDKSHDLKQNDVTVYSVGVYAGQPSNKVSTFMNFYSSNYKNATSMSNGGEKTGSDYFLKASNAAEITEIFENIAHAIQTPTISLTSETTIKDIVTPQFTLPENTSEINIYTDNSVGGENFANNRQPATGVNINIDGSTLTVDGFDFNDNFVSETPKDGASDYGKKLIIEFVVELDPDYLGGTALQTNGEESGVVDPNGNTVAKFDVPSVDVPLKRIEPVAQNWNVYLSTEEQLSNLFETLQFTINGHTVNYPDIFDGINNAGADVEFDIKDSDGQVVYTYTIPAGSTSGDWHEGTLPILKDEKYTVSCVVKDHNNGNNSEEANASININVFKPILTFEDKNVYYKGAQIDVSAVTPTRVEWKHGNTLDSDVTMHTDKPTLTYTYLGVTGDTVDLTSDYNVKVEKIGKVGDDSYNFLSDATKDSVSFLRNCTSEPLNGEEATAEEAFKIHVYTPSVAFEDTEAYYGDTVTLTPPTVADSDWKDGEGNSAPSTMDNNKPEVAVDLTPESGKVKNNYVAVADDFNVAATIKIGDTDVTSDLITARKLTRTCGVDGAECGNTLAVTTDCAFVVHVKTVTLSVTKKIEGMMADKTAKYNFDIKVTPAAASGIEEISQTNVTLGDGNVQTFDGLPLGEFSVKETNPKADYKVSFKVNDGRDVVVPDAEISGELAKDTTDVTVTNKLDYIPPTGIAGMLFPVSVVTVLVSIAGLCLIGIYSRKRRYNR